jgi:hypothetical protein
MLQLPIDCPNHVPSLVVDEAGDMVWRKPWHDPALEAPMTNAKEKQKGKQKEFLPLPKKDNATRECGKNGKKKT